MAAEDTHRGSTQTDIHFRSPLREARLSPSASPPTASVPEQFPFSALPVPTALPAKRLSIPPSKASKAERPAPKIKKEERPRKPAPPKAPKQAPEPPPQPVLNRMLLQFVPAPSPYVYPTIREAKSTMAVPTPPQITVPTVVPMVVPATASTAYGNANAAEPLLPPQ